MVDQIERDFLSFIRRYRLEYEIENVKRMLEVGLEMREAVSLGG